MNKELCREITQSEITNELFQLQQNYMKVYDEYYKTGSRDSAFLKDLVDAIKGISACLDVYTRDGYIDNRYASEKLKFTLDMVQSVKDFYDMKAAQHE